MRMKTFLNISLLTAVLTLAWGCTKESDSTTGGTHYTVTDAPTAPQWDVIRDMDWTSDEARPDWTDPDPLLFESTMILQVKLDEDLIAYASSQDLMAVMLGNECRAVSMCNVKGGDEPVVAYFIMAIKGNSNERDVPMSVHYYCAKLRQTFVMNDIIMFVPEMVYGIYDDSENFQPYFSMGSTKFPVTTFVSLALTGNVPFTMQTGDKLALFVGDELRGAVEIDDSTRPDDIFCILFAKRAGETVGVRYYSKAQGRIYRMSQTFLSADDEVTVRLEF